MTRVFFFLDWNWNWIKFWMFSLLKFLHKGLLKSSFILLSCTLSLFLSPSFKQAHTLSFSSTHTLTHTQTHTHTFSRLHSLGLFSTCIKGLIRSINQQIFLTSPLSTNLHQLYLMDSTSNTFSLLTAQQLFLEWVQGSNPCSWFIRGDKWWGQKRPKKEIVLGRWNLSEHDFKK